MDFADWADEVEAGLHNATWFPSEEVRAEMEDRLGRVFEHRPYSREELAGLFREAAAPSAPVPDSGTPDTSKES
jgi:hypothetical protein